MKKWLLFFVALGLVTWGNEGKAQDRKVPVSKVQIGKYNSTEANKRDYELGTAVEFSTPRSLPKQKTSISASNLKTTGTTSYSFNPVNIGTSSNVYSILRVTQSQVCANSNLGVITFVHRNDVNNYPAPASGASGIPRYDFYDGSNWNVDLGPIIWYTDPGATSPASNYRYPQGALSGGASVQDLRLIGMFAGHIGGVWGYNGFGTVTDPSGAIAGGLIQATPTNTNITFWAPDSNFMELIPGGLTVRGNVAIAVDNYYNGSADKIKDTLWVWRGMLQGWNPDSTAWTRTALLIPNVSFVPDSFEANIGWVNAAASPDGSVWWIAIEASVDDNGNPYDVDTIFESDLLLYKSTDDGQTWSGPMRITFRDFSNLTQALKVVFIDSSGNPVDSTTQIPYLLSYDIAVDTFGNPHIFASFVNAADSFPHRDSTGYVITSITVLADITTNDGGNTWKANLINVNNTWKTTYPGDNSLGYYGGYPQVGTDPTGVIVYYTWGDDTSSTLSSTDTQQPDLWFAVWDVKGDSFLTTPTDVTSPDNLYDGLAWWPTTSPLGLVRTTGNGLVLEIPVVVTTSTSDPLAQTQWVYFGIVDSLGNSVVVHVENEDKAQLPLVALPNPVTTTFLVKGTLANKTNLTFELMDIQGRTIEKRVVEGVSTLNEVFDLSSQPEGFYILKVSSPASVKTFKLIKQ